jgi:hypothetical protein
MPEHCCIFHRSGNSAQLGQNLGISVGGFELPPPRYTTVATVTVYKITKHYKILKYATRHYKTMNIPVQG